MLKLETSEEKQLEVVTIVAHMERHIDSHIERLGEQMELI
jgi:hypothetical protein